ncbi:hypothetical protein SYNPS1DRAFT_29763 [Syncephalis pseudoplumigaleata]|uniref:PX domain-containing protein n=1 Tax=Syncephalis pseudoplumigaleata TaxID=1712513 RepID=A0A4P9YWJ5_9FUNG|nr:hypothetical protein SYNPS1DRAFT_29763 [Syncephalis pseudoplumigaleata]|eukprot:RKP24473.1 hypothetical protein SYNPS1DRAFT_29763 [Syncephalis pseudoplumigaleata]
MMTTKSNSNSNRDDLISAAQYEGIKLAPALSHARLVGHEVIDDEIWYQVDVQPKPVTVMKHAQTVSFHRKPYTIYRRYEDFQCFTHQLCEEFEQNAELIRQLSTCIGAAFDNEFDQNITQQQRQEDLGTFLVQLFETSHIVLTSRPVMEFLGRWHTDDDLSLRCKEALHQMRRPRNQRTRSLNDIRSAMKQHAAQLLANKPLSKGKSFSQGHRPTRSGSSHAASGSLSLGRPSGECDRSLLAGSNGPLPPFNIAAADDDGMLTDEEPSKARMRKVRSFTHVRARVSSLFTGKRSSSSGGGGGDDDDGSGGDGYRRGRHGRRGSEGSALSVRRTSSGQSQAVTPAEDVSISYGLPGEYKLPDLDNKQSTELLSDLHAILQQNNISSPQGEPGLSELLQQGGRGRFKHRDSSNSSVDLSSTSFDQYLPSSMKRATNAASPPSSQPGSGASTGTLARFLAQAAAHRDSCNNSPVLTAAPPPPPR